MSRTFIRQDVQIRNSVTYDDAIAPSEAAFETNPANIETDLNNIRSQVHNLLDVQASNWWNDLITPSALDAGSQRGVNDLNTDLHALERKRVLVASCALADVSVPAAAQHVVLGAGELPANTTIAVGAVTTAGTVAAQATTFDTAGLDEVGGSTAVSPKNLVEIFDGTTRDPILDSSGKRIHGLLQSESATDGHTATTTTPTRLQISFVVLNAAGDDLQLAAGADIGGSTINICFTERKAMEDLTEQDFLRGAIADIPGSATVTRQVGYDNQGTTPVDLTTNATLDLEGAGLVWAIRDDLEAVLFSITEGSAGGTSTVAVGADVDTFDVNAVVNDFLNGASFDTGAAGTTINVGVTANTIDSGGALTVASGGAGDLTLDATGGELFFDDVNRDTSGFSVPLKLAETAAEWDQLETDFGEVSLASMLHQAYTRSGRVKGYAVVTAATIAADTNVTGAGGAPNIDAQLPDYSGVDTFVDDVDVYLNGELLRNGADAAANNDVYPGDSAANGDLKFEFALLGSPGNADTLCVIVWNS